MEKAQPVTPITSPPAEIPDTYDPRGGATSPLQRTRDYAGAGERWGER